MLSPVNSIRFGSTNNYKKNYSNPKTVNMQPSFCALKRPSKLASLIGGIIMAFGATSAKAAGKAKKISVQELLQVFKGRITNNIVIEKGKTTFSYADATSGTYAGELEINGASKTIKIPENKCELIYHDKNGDGIIDGAPEVDCSKPKIRRVKF